MLKIIRRRELNQVIGANSSTHLYRESSFNAVFVLWEISRSFLGFVPAYHLVSRGGFTGFVRLAKAIIPVIQKYNSAISRSQGRLDPIQKRNFWAKGVCQLCNLLCMTQLIVFLKTRLFRPISCTPFPPKASRHEYFFVQQLTKRCCHQFSILNVRMKQSGTKTHELHGKNVVSIDLRMTAYDCEVLRIFPDIPQR